MSSNWDKRAQYEQTVEPLVNQLYDACNKAGLPLAVAVQYNGSEESIGISVSYDVEHAEPGGVMCWLGAVLEAMGNNRPIPIPASPPVVGMMLGSEDDYISLLKQLGATPADLEAAMANATIADITPVMTAGKVSD